MHFDQAPKDEEYRHLNRNLHNDLDEASEPGQNRPQTKEGATNTHTGSVEPNSGESGASTSSRVGQMNLRSRHKSKLVNKATMTNGDGGDGAGFMYWSHQESDWSLAACCCSKLFWLLLLLLIPLMLFAANRLDESDVSKLRDFKMFMEPNRDALVHLWALLRQPLDFFRFLIVDYLPHLLGLFAALFKSSSSVDTGYFKELVPDFKPATSGNCLIFRIFSQNFPSDQKILISMSLFVFKKEVTT